MWHKKMSSTYDKFEVSEKGNVENTFLIWIMLSFDVDVKKSQNRNFVQLGIDDNCDSLFCVAKLLADSCVVSILVRFGSFDDTASFASPGGTLP